MYDREKSRQQLLCMHTVLMPWMTWLIHSNTWAARVWKKAGSCWRWWVLYCWAQSPRFIVSPWRADSSKNPLHVLWLHKAAPPLHLRPCPGSQSRAQSQAKCPECLPASTFIHRDAWKELITSKDVKSTQNHRIRHVGRGCSGSAGPTLLLK